MPDTDNTASDSSNADATASADTSAEGNSSPFNGQYDEARAARLIENLRADLDKKSAKIKAFEDAQKTEAEKTTEALAEAQRKAAQLELEIMRRDVATDKGVPPSLAKFLSGDSREALEAIADELMSGVGQIRKPAPDLKQGQQSSNSGPKQLARADLARMSAEEINSARRDGLLNDVLGIKP